MNERQPVSNIPTPVIFMSALLVTVHVFRSFLSVRMDFDLLLLFAFIPARFAAGVSFPGGDLADIWTFVTYAFLHGGLSHLIINVVWFACFGTALARRFGFFRLFAVFLAGSVGGAALHLAVLPGDGGMLIGASAGISATMAATLRFAFEPHGPLAGGWTDPASYHVRAPGILELFSNRRASSFILVWIVVNLAIGFQEFFVAEVSNLIAWQAHIGGFVAGFLLFPLLDPYRQDRGRPRV